jgi:integrase
MPAPSGQIPPPWTWRENEAPATRAACRPASGRLVCLFQDPADVVGAAVDDRDGDDAGHLVWVFLLGSLILAPEVLDTLRSHRAYQATERLSRGPHYAESGLVITAEDGRPMHPETLWGVFIRQAKRAGLPPIRLHDLRHSVASILLARGVHPKVVSDMLGHATIALTLDTYSHVIPSLQQEAASVVAAAVLDPSATAPQPSPKGQIRAITSGS